jgi:hypothetical protein
VAITPSEIGTGSGGGAVGVFVGLLLMVGTILWGVIWQLPHEEKKEAENLATAIRTVSVKGSSEIKTLSKGPSYDGGVTRDISVVLRYDIRNVDTKQHDVHLCTLTGIPHQSFGELPGITEWCVDLVVLPKAHLRGAKQSENGMTLNPYPPRYRVLVKPYIDSLDGGMVVTNSNSLIPPSLR